MPLDRPKFVKVLQMTLSENDAEALTAIRTANRMLSEAKVGWSGLISGARVSGGSPMRSSTVHPPPWVRPAPSKSIGEALEFLDEREGGEWTGLRREWERRKQMSPYDQRRVFERVYQLERQENDSRDIPE